MLYPTMYLYADRHHVENNGHCRFHLSPQPLPTPVLGPAHLAHTGPCFNAASHTHKHATKQNLYSEERQCEEKALT